MTMVKWTKEQLEEMFGDNVIEQLAFVAGCTKHSYSDTKNTELDGFIVSHESLSKYAELIVRECAYYADVFEALGCPVDMDPTETKPSDYIKREMGVQSETV